MASERNEASATISVDWKKLWSFLMRFITGLGLALFWVALAILTLAALGWAGVYVAKLPIAGILGMAITVPIILCVWWISYYMALDFLDEIGVSLEGPWRWLIIPIALPFAPLSFFLGYVAGLGELAKTQNSAFAFLGMGILFLLTVAFLFLR